MNALCESLADTEVETCPAPETESGCATWHPTGSQAIALAKLHQMAAVFTRTGNAKLAGFRPQCQRALLIGASGSGKTAVANQFATELGVPLLALDCGSWLVAGALAKPATLRLARDFIRSCKPGISPTGSESGLAGILYLDEICKLVPAGESLTQNAWSLSVFSEAISLLSGDSRLAAHDWSSPDIKHLQNFMILGGGAFAAALSEVHRTAKKGSLGFADFPSMIRFPMLLRSASFCRRKSYPASPARYWSWIHPLAKTLSWPSPGFTRN